MQIRLQIEKKKRNYCAFVINYSICQKSDASYYIICTQVETVYLDAIFYTVEN